MKKQDYIWVGLLVALLFGWPYLDRLVIRPSFFKNMPAKTRPAVTNVAAAVTNAAVPAATGTVAEARIAAAPEKPASAPVPEPAVEAAAARPETHVTLSNAVARLDFSSRGGGLAGVTLLNYRSHLEKDSPPVQLDFSSRRTLAYDGLAGFDESQDFDLAADAGGRKLTATRRTAQGLRLVRTMELQDRYILAIKDEFANESAAAVTLPAHEIQVGPMRREAGHRDAAGFVSLGIDSLSPGGEDVHHWSRELAKLFDRERKAQSLPKLPVRLDHQPELKSGAVDWVAAKNKYFAQILTPSESAEGLTLHLARELAAAEKTNPSYAPKMTPIEEVAVSLRLAGIEVAPGTNLVRQYTLYVGPKRLADLSQRPLHQDEVMEVGNWLKPVSKALMWMLNAIHSVIPSYGVAIMLLTLVIRFIFWPLTHKSSQSMKRMAEIQPLVKEIQEKYKKDPQRMQAEMMRIYKENKVNPVSGCLPMFIQIPIFFSLFMVLRSSIELRFAPFLWIRDLSEPENLLVNVIGFPINILPLLMAGTMYWQQKITPTAGDPQQAKMMRVMMTGMMLFFLYSYAAGLALYWTTQNLLMIGQQLWMQRKKATAARK